MIQYSKVILHCDGGSRGNPGRAAIGLVITDENGKQLEAYKEYIGIATNNVAEYSSLLKSLELASKYTNNEVLVNMDSELVIRQMKGEYKIKAVHLKALFVKVKEKEKLFKKVTYTWNRRETPEQAKADALVNEALDGY